MFNILVVEDHRDLLEITCLFLTRKGYNVIPAENGSEALGKIESNYIDLCVLDLMMPEMDGYEFIDLIKRHNYDFPIIVTTAKSAFVDMEKGFTLGADDYLVKPINYDELNLRIKALLRRAKIANDKELVKVTPCLIMTL